MTRQAMPRTIRLDEPSPQRPAACPVEDWMTFLGHRWTSLILWHLQSRPMRYGELAGCLPGISPKVLKERLEGLERRGLIKRTRLATYPRGVQYELSSAGATLVPILDQIELWSKQNDRA